MSQGYNTELDPQDFYNKVVVGYECEDDHYYEIGKVVDYQEELEELIEEFLQLNNGAIQIIHYYGAMETEESFGNEDLIDIYENYDDFKAYKDDNYPEKPNAFTIYFRSEEEKLPDEGKHGTHKLTLYLPSDSDLSQRSIMRFLLSIRNGAVGDVFVMSHSHMGGMNISHNIYDYGLIDCVDIAIDGYGDKYILEDACDELSWR